MEVLTNNRKMEATAILEYFAPLNDWLIKTNNDNGVEIGWDLTYGKRFNWKCNSVLLLIYLPFLQSAPLLPERKCQFECVNFTISNKNKNSFYQTYGHHFENQFSVERDNKSHAFHFFEWIASKSIGSESEEAMNDLK